MKLIERGYHKQVVVAITYQMLDVDDKAFMIVAGEERKAGRDGRAAASGENGEGGE